MSTWLKRFKDIFTVNPNWTTSILPPNSFRVPSPGSIFGYTGAQRRVETFTSGYAYYKRDTRRSFPATVAVTSRSVSGLLPIPDRIAALETKEFSEILVPGKRRNYKKAADQPPASGYFPIINCD